jgi:sialic acid synthase SpsE
MRIGATIATAGDVGVLSREQKEQRGLVPAPIRVDGFEPLRWAECRLIAEIGGPSDLNWAIRAAEAAKQAGFWAVKTQLLNRHDLISRRAPTYGKGIGQAEDQWDEFALHGLNPEQLNVLHSVCADLGLVFFASVWDEDSAERALNCCDPLLKIGSGDITHELLLRYLAHLGVPVILSTGASEWWEIEQALDWLQDAPQLALAACTLSYPAEAQDANLNRIASLKRMAPYRLVGYSDHCREPWIVGEAKKCKAEFVEVHWTVTPGEGGDHDFALHPGNISEMNGTPEGWNGDHLGDGMLQPMPCELAARTGARRSICSAFEIPEGEHWRMQDMLFLRPGGGLDPWRWSELLGRRVTRDYDERETVDEAV